MPDRSDEAHWQSRAEEARTLSRSSRPHLPAKVARKLRQEAGFGCCLCGNPIIQYHHIVGWSAEEHFRPADMMVLCPLHHDQATKGAMPEAEQRRYKVNPRNVAAGRTKGLLAVRQDYCAADFGSVTVVGSGPFLSVGGEPILGFELGEGNLEMSLRLYSEADELLIEIDHNEWTAGDPLPWDIEADWQSLVLRERARQISLSLDATQVPMTVQGEFWRFGKRFSIDRLGINLWVGGTPGRRLGGFKDIALVGTTLDISMKEIGSFGPPNGSKGMLISWPDHRERLWKAKDAWLALKATNGEPPL